MSGWTTITVLCTHLLTDSLVACEALAVMGKAAVNTVQVGLGFLLCTSWCLTLLLLPFEVYLLSSPLERCKPCDSRAWPLSPSPSLVPVLSLKPGLLGDANGWPTAAPGVHGGLCGMGCGAANRAVSRHSLSFLPSLQMCCDHQYSLLRMGL